MVAWIDHPFSDQPIVRSPTWLLHEQLVDPISFEYTRWFKEVILLYDCFKVRHCQAL